MSTLNSWDPYKHRWKQFVFTFLDPFVLVLSAVTLVLAIWLNREKAAESDVIASLTMMLAIVSGLLGGELARRWTLLTEGATMVARGTLAVRSLKLLFGKLFGVQSRVSQYLSRYSDEKERKVHTSTVVKTYLEETLLHTRSLMDDVLSAIDNWTDVVPGADIKGQIQQISQLVADRERLDDDLKAARSELQHLQDMEEEFQGREDELKTLRERVRQREDELSRVKRELNKKGAGSVGPVFIGGEESTMFSGAGTLINDPITFVGSTSTFLPSGLTISTSRNCSDCGKTFFQTGGLLTAETRCPECQLRMIK